MRSALRLLLAPLFTIAPAVAFAQQQDIQRALIQRDQQSAEFAAQVRGGIEARRKLELLHERQLREAGPPLSADPEIARELLPYQRDRMSQESGYVLRLPPPTVRAPREPAIDAPLPLPGGRSPGVEPVAAPSVGG